ncbi:Alpha/Beta hydrolase protein, partial [Thamnocephalis sphaerospora]
FYWYFPAEKPVAPSPSQTPLIIWLQGGPGSSSMLGLFNQHGPFSASSNKELVRRKVAWTRHYDVIYLDQPVGAGFSYAAPGFNASRTLQRAQITLSPEECRAAGYVTTEVEVGRDVLSFLARFYQIYPSLRERPLYVTGESYAGKFAPAIARSIIRHNHLSAPTDHIPLAGIAIGDGLSVPEVQVLYHAKIALAFGLISPSQAEALQKLCNESSALALRQRYEEARQKRDMMFTRFSEYTGGVNWYDIRKRDVPKNNTLVDAFLEQPSVVSSLNANGRTWFSDPNTKMCLYDDIMQSVADLFPAILSHCRVLLFQGQFDFRDGPMGNEAWIRQLDWPGRDGFNSAPRKPWRIYPEPGGLSGYATEYGNLSHVVQLSAGHFAGMDSPEATLQMLDRWIHGRAIAD